MCLAVDEDWFQSHQNVVWVFDTQQYAAAVDARRRVLCLKRRAADKIGIARQFRRGSHPGSFDRRILRYERLVCGALDQDVMTA